MFDLLDRHPALVSHPFLWLLATKLPRLFTGRALHAMALHALHEGDVSRALALFHEGGLAYRRVVSVDALARLRVHELMACVRAGGGATPIAGTRFGRGESLVLETERRLARLERIETLEPPFTMVDARFMMASWWSAGADAYTPQAAARAA